MLITDIQRFCTHDGPGIRTTVFFKGCPLRCAWCHNPETQNHQKELLFYKEKCIGCGKCETCDSMDCTVCGECAKNCPTGAREVVGKEYTAKELFNQIKKDFAFYSDSGGVTFSGGECMIQVEQLSEVLEMCKKNSIHTAVDTAGYVPFENFSKVLPYTDLFLYDIKALDSEEHKYYVGVDNKLILSNLKRLFKVGAKIWIRIPIIPSVNDSVEDMWKIKDYLDACGSPEKIELLPYNPMGESKYHALGKTQPTFGIPNREKIELLRKIFK